MAAVPLAALGLLAACGAGEELTRPETGALTVTVATAGNAPDPDGFTLTVDGGAGVPLEPTDTFALAEVEPGEHRVELSGIAANCLVSGLNPLDVTVVVESPVTAEFKVTCTSAPATGQLQVRVVTSGTDPDPDGYQVIVDSLPPHSVGPTDSVTFDLLTVGTHAVRLDGMAATCEVRDQNPQSVEVGSELGSISFHVSCWPPPEGLIAFARSIAESEAEIFVQNAAGTGFRNVTDSPTSQKGPPACSPDGSVLAFAGATLDENGFPTGGTALFLVATGGGAPTPLAAGLQPLTTPVWSPDGRTILFSGEFTTGTDLGTVRVADGERSTIVSSSFDGFTTGAVWSPDSRRIAVGQFSFALNTATLQLVDPDGGHPRTIADESTLPGRAFFVGSWSPSGSQIVVTVSHPFQDLFLVDTLSSTPPVNLTRDQANYQSVSWSPDGAMLLFVKVAAGAQFAERDVYTLRLSDLALTKLTARSGAYVLPAWSPDGTHIVFGEEELFLGPLNLFIVNIDGSGLRQLTAGQHRDNGPCWMP